MGARYWPNFIVLLSSLFLLAQGCMPKGLQGKASMTKSELASQAQPENESALPENPSSEEGDGGESGKIANEPAAIAGSFLVDASKVKVSRTASTAEVSGDALAVLEMPGSRPKVLNVELYAYDSATRDIELQAGLLVLKLRKIASSQSAADGSFTLQSAISPSDWLFVNILSDPSNTLTIDPSKTQTTVVWIDNDGNRPRTLDQAAAHSLRGLISPSQSLIDSIALMRATSACVACDLNGADLRVNNINAYDLRGAQLIGAKFNGSSVTNSNLRYANLRGADFTNSFLAMTDFTGAQVTAANFKGSDTVSSIGLALPLPLQ